MNKKLLVFIISLLMFPISVSAKEYCTIVSGNGKDIGSEIACGEEHFYVLENKDNKIKMLSKYNLYVGSNYNKIALDINDTFEKMVCTLSGNNSNYSCSWWNTGTKYIYEGEEVSYSDWRNSIFEKYNIEDTKEMYNIEGEDSTGNFAYYSYIYGEMYDENGSKYQNRTYKFYPYTTIFSNTKGYALQNELAKGVTGEKGNANYPIYATLLMFNDDHTLSFFVKSLNNYKDGYTDFEYNDSEEIKVRKYLNAYLVNLGDLGYDVLDIDIPSIKDIDGVVYSVSNKNLPLTDWYEYSLDEPYIDEDPFEYQVLGDLKEYLSDDYSWLWNTSYWTKTLVGNIEDTNVPTAGSNWNDSIKVYFVSSSGEICYSASDCWSSIPRSGLRPIITISTDSIKYLIKTETDGNGTIEVIDSASGGDSIQFKVTAKKGLKLSGLTITTDAGEEVTFSEEEITTDDTGVLSVSTNKFTMPYDNITIRASWRMDVVPTPTPINEGEDYKVPDTGAYSVTAIFVLILLSMAYGYYILKEKNQ